MSSSNFLKYPMKIQYDHDELTLNTKQNINI